MAGIINDPKIGTVVRHTGWGFENDKNYPCDVLIIDGSYTRNGRVSNFWEWKRVLPDGSLSELERGYGSFLNSSEKYDIEIRVNRVLL